MTGLSDYSGRKILDHLVGKTSFTMPVNVYVALFTALPSDAGAGGTEVTGGSYARKQTVGADWNAAAGSAPATNSNANDLAFPAPTADWATPANPIIGFGLYDSAVGGSNNLLFADYLGGFQWQPCVALAGDLSPNTLECPAHGFVANDPVVFSTEFQTGAIPTGVTAGTVYYVIATGLTADAFEISATVGGAAVDVTAVGKAMVKKIQQKAVQNGDGAPKFAGGAPGQFVLSAV
jgi:hypothetical protein